MPGLHQTTIHAPMKTMEPSGKIDPCSLQFAIKKKVVPRAIQGAIPVAMADVQAAATQTATAYAILPMGKVPVTGAAIAVVIHSAIHSATLDARQVAMFALDNPPLNHPPLNHPPP